MSAGENHPLLVALYAGIFVRHDAVSNSLRCKVEILDALRRHGAPVEFTVFTEASDYQLDSVRPMASVMELLRQDEFWSADTHIFEFGMHYSLFDSVFVIPAGRPVAVVEHNTTPPELVDDPEVRHQCERSLEQRSNMLRATHVICDSEFNLGLARQLELPDDRLSVLHLPPAHRPRSRSRAMGSGAGPVRLLYIGRFVRAKGLDDLLRAASALWRRDECPFTLTLAGSPRFSDPLVVTQLRESLAEFGEKGPLQVVTDPADDRIAELLGSSDALVIPSHHEGYCVPVVEAYASGCYVIASDAGNLPNVVGGLGTLVPVGDVEALAHAMRDFVDRLRQPLGDGPRLATSRGDMDHASWCKAVARHLEGYSETAYEVGFLEVLRQLASASPAGVCPSLEHAIAERVAQSGASSASRPVGA